MQIITISITIWSILCEIIPLPPHCYLCNFESLATLIYLLRQISSCPIKHFLNISFTIILILNFFFLILKILPKHLILNSFNLFDICITHSLFEFQLNIIPFRWISDNFLDKPLIRIFPFGCEILSVFRFIYLRLFLFFLKSRLCSWKGKIAKRAI